MQGPFRGKPSSELRAYAPSSESSAEDFLFHLYRGSELLQDDRVHQAKEELEAALRLQPRDPKGQDLLAVVYFRLGLYPRAIEIYEELVRAFPKDASLGNNLALCYLKTGQSEKARSILEALVMHQPEHVRAWAYLGLAYERLGDYGKAKEAFERGQATGMARRMAERLSDNARHAEDLGEGLAPTEGFEELEDKEVALSIPPPRSIPPEAGVPVGSIPPPLPSLRPVRQTAGELSRRLALESPESASLVETESGMLLVRLEASFAIRIEAMRAIVTKDREPRSETLPRRFDGAPAEELLGGSIAPLVALHASGELLLGPRPSHRLVPFVLEGERLVVRESALVGFDGRLEYASRKLPGSETTPLHAVEFEGQGAVVLEVGAGLVSMAVDGNRPAIVRRDVLVGWLGELDCRLLSPSEAPGRALGLVALRGEGTVFLDEGRLLP